MTKNSTHSHNNNNEILNILSTSIDTVDIKFLKYLKLNNIIYHAMVNLINLYASFTKEQIVKYFLAIDSNTGKISILNTEKKILQKAEEQYPNITRPGVILLLRGLFVIHQNVHVYYKTKTKDTDSILTKDKDLFIYDKIMNSDYSGLEELAYKQISEMMDNRNVSKEMIDLTNVFLKVFQNKFVEYPGVLNNPLFKRGEIVANIDKYLNFLNTHTIKNDIWNADKDENNLITQLCGIRDGILQLLWDDLLTNSKVGEKQRTEITRSLPNIDDKSLVKISRNNTFLFLSDYILNDIILNFQKEKYFYNETIQLIMTFIIQAATTDHLVNANVFALSLRILLKDETKSFIINKCTSQNPKISEKYKNRLNIIFMNIRDFIITLKSSHPDDFDDIINNSDVEYYGLSKKLYDDYKPLYERIFGVIKNEIL